MAVAAGILHQVFLVVFFRGKEVPERLQFHGQLRADGFFLFPVYGFDFRKLFFIGLVDARPVLDSFIMTLPVD